METIITVLSTLGCGGIVLAIVNHFLNKRKYISEVKESDISNLERTLEFYKKVTEDQTSKLTTYMHQTEKLMIELAVVRESITELYKMTCTNFECHERSILNSKDYKNLLSKLNCDKVEDGDKG